MQEKLAKKNASENDKKETTKTKKPSTASSPSPQRQNEEPDVCCICLDELSKRYIKNLRATCCGKQWHVKCHEGVLNSKMPDNLKHRCHQCRTPTPETSEEGVSQIRDWLVKGKSWAQRQMANLYRFGTQGVEQSYDMAVMLHEKAIAQGNRDAMFDLGCMHRNGEGVAQSFQKALELLTMAADHGQSARQQSEPV